MAFQVDDYIKKKDSKDGHVFCIVNSYGPRFVCQDITLSEDTENWFMKADIVLATETECIKAVEVAVKEQHECIDNDRTLTLKEIDKHFTI